MFKLMKNSFVNNALSRCLLGVVALIIIGAANIAVSAQSCSIVVSGVSGDLSNFNVSGSGTTSLTIDIPAATVGVWGSVVTGTTVNVNVNISPIPTGSKAPVFVTASKVNANQAGSFTLVATDSVGHTITISAVVDCPVAPRGCTRTQGFYKNKPEEWAVQSLTLGTRTYTQAQLLSIFKTPVRGNGLVSLSHQLIAAKLNAAAGTSVPASVATAIAAADALIGGLVVPPVGSGSLSTSSTSSLTSILDTYNNGNTPGGPPHCDD